MVRNIISRGENSELGELGRAVRQGYPVSPLQFNTYIQLLILQALENSEDGVVVGGMQVNAIVFADDKTMISSSNTGLQDYLNGTSGEYDMRINIKKTKTMRTSRKVGIK